MSLKNNRVLIWKAVNTNSREVLWGGGWGQKLDREVPLQKRLSLLWSSTLLHLTEFWNVVLDSKLQFIYFIIGLEKHQHPLYYRSQYSMRTHKEPFWIKQKAHLVEHFPQSG